MIRQFASIAIIGVGMPMMAWLGPEFGDQMQAAPPVWTMLMVLGAETALLMVLAGLSWCFPTFRAAVAGFVVGLAICFVLVPSLGTIFLFAYIFVVFLLFVAMARGMKNV